MKKRILTLSLFLSPALSLAQTAACQDFDKVVHLETEDTKAGFQMDQILVRKNGQSVYQ